MTELDRITLKYLAPEDRVRLTGEAAEGVVVVWITRRLLDRLVPRLLCCLEKPTNDERRDPLRANALQSFAQHAARSVLVPQDPVRADENDTQWLAQSIDVSFSRSGVRVSFSGASAQRASLTLEERKLRQLLSILHEVYRKADWSTNAWPRWACSSDWAETAAVQIH